MSRRLLCIALLLVAPVATAVSFRPVKPNDVIELPEEGEELLGELEWRSIAMRNDDGLVPIGALYAANLFRLSQLHLLGKAAASITAVPLTSRGPQNVGGRTRSLLINPNNASVMYAGSVGGGVWKTTNGGTMWSPLSQFSSNIGVMTLAFDPTVSDRSVIYAGTGELFLRGDGIQGAGVFRSADSGATWTQLAATASWSQVSRLATSSSGAILAAGTGGIWLSTNQGQQWTNTFPSNGGLGFAVAFDPTNPNNAVAEVMDPNIVTNFQHKILYSQDGGAHWSLASLPSTLTTTSDHIELAYAPSSPNIVYANTSANGGEVWRSTNGGQTFTRVSPQGFTTTCDFGRCAIWVSPLNANFVIFGGAFLYRTPDGFNTMQAIANGETLSGIAHVDFHTVVPSPGFSIGSPRVYVCTDGGIYRADDITTAASDPLSWVDLNATYVTSQFHAASGNAVTGMYVGGTQDTGSLASATSDPNARRILTGDGGVAIIDPSDPNYIYISAQYLALYRFRNGAPPGANAEIIYFFGPKPLLDSDPNGTNGTAAFVAPFALSSRDPNVMFAAGKSVWRSTNVRADVPQWDRIRPPDASVALALAVTKADPNVLWIAESDRTIAMTTNALALTPTWTTISSSTLPLRPATSIFIDPLDAHIVYLTFGGFDGHSLFRSMDGGATWSAVYGSGLTALPPAPARTFVRHPRNSSVLFVGTEIGLYESDNGGASWSAIDAGPGDSPVYDLKFVHGTDQLLIATHGRGLWSADTSSVPSFYPSNLVATAATNPLRVNLSWNAYAGATSYELLKSSLAGPFNTTPIAATTSYVDTSVNEDTTYLYRIRAITSSGRTDPSRIEIATTTTFTNDNQLGGRTILALHMQEIRDAANMVLTAAGLSNISFPTLTTVKQSDVIGVRSALMTAYNALDLPIPTFTDPVITPHASVVRATHFQELRDKTK